MSGEGKVAGGWAAVKDDAAKRYSFGQKRQQFLESLPSHEKDRIQKISNDPYTSTTLPGTEKSQRWDEEERVFLSGLPDSDCCYLKSHLGLGNSQKAECAWLDKRHDEAGDTGFLYEVLDVRDFTRNGDKG